MIPTKAAWHSVFLYLVLFSMPLRCYRSVYKKCKSDLKRKIFEEDKGTYIAELKIEKDDGLADEPSTTGHFTFHEYDSCDLKKNIQGFFNIFDHNGTFTTQ